MPIELDELSARASMLPAEQILVYRLAPAAADLRFEDT